MKVTYDSRGGIAYVDLRGPDQAAGPVSSSTFTPPGGTDADDYFVLDFDSDGRLVGIEVLVPGRRLLPSVLAQAEAP